MGNTNPDLALKGTYLDLAPAVFEPNTGITMTTGLRQELYKYETPKYIFLFWIDNYNKLTRITRRGGQIEHIDLRDVDAYVPERRSIVIHNNDLYIIVGTSGSDPVAGTSGIDSRYAVTFKWTVIPDIGNPFTRSSLTSATSHFRNLEGSLGPVTFVTTEITNGNPTFPWMDGITSSEDLQMEIWQITLDRNTNSHSEVLLGVTSLHNPSALADVLKDGWRTVETPVPGTTTYEKYRSITYWDHGVKIYEGPLEMNSGDTSETNSQARVAYPEDRERYGNETRVRDNMSIGKALEAYVLKEGPAVSRVDLHESLVHFNQIMQGLLSDKFNNTYILVNKDDQAYGAFFIRKYNSVGSLLWERQVQLYYSHGVTSYTRLTALSRPRLYEDHSKMLFGYMHQWYYIDLATGDIDWQFSGSPLVTDTYYYKSEIVLDIQNTTTEEWEPKLLISTTETSVQESANITFGWSTILIAKYALTINVVDPDGNPVDRYEVRNRNTGLEIQSYEMPYKYSDPFTLDFIPPLGYLASQKEYLITNQETLTIVVTPVDWNNRNTYYVSTPQDVLNIRNDAYGIYIQVNDIDMSATYFESPFPKRILSFCGDYDGKGFTIANLDIEPNSTVDYSGYLGFFGQVYRARIQNLTLANISINKTVDNGTDAGILIGYMDMSSDAAGIPIMDTFLTNCHVKDSTIYSDRNNRGDKAGMVAYGYVYPEFGTVTISNLTTRNITLQGTGGEYLGGLFAQLESYTEDVEDAPLILENLYATMTADLNGNSNQWGTGGIISYGYFSTSVVMRRIETELVLTNGNHEATGLIGEAYYNSPEVVFEDIAAKVSSPGIVGDAFAGLVGWYELYEPNYSTHTAVTINNLYVALNGEAINSLGVVTGYHEENASVTYNTANSYYDSSITSQPSQFDLVPKPTELMYKQATFTNWDFANTWMIDEDNDYPTLIFAADSPVSLIVTFVGDALDVPGLEIRVGAFKYLHAVAVFENGTTEVIESGLKVQSEEVGYVSIDNRKVRALKEGFTNLLVSYRGKVETVSIELYGPDELILSAPEKVNLGSKHRLFAVASYRDSFTEDVSLLGTWSSNDPATVASTEEGVIEALAGGYASIQFKFGSLTNNAFIEVVSVEFNAPTIIDVNNESATLYVYFQLNDPPREMVQFQANAYTDEALTQQLVGINVTDNPSKFKVSINEGITWNTLTSAGWLAEMPDREVYVAELYVGTKNKLWVNVGMGASGTPAEGGVEDVFSPALAISEASGAYNRDLSIVLETNEEAKIYYTLDDTTPSKSSAVYSSPLQITTDTDLRTFAVDTAGNPSRVHVRNYRFDRVAPILTLSNTGGKVFGPQDIEITSSKPATIYYTLDETEPTIDSVEYTGAILITADATLKCFAVDPAGNISAIVTAVYAMEELPAGHSFEAAIPLLLETVVSAIAYPEFPVIHFRLDNFELDVQYEIAATTPETIDMKFFTSTFNDYGFYANSNAMRFYSDGPLHYVTVIFDAPTEEKPFDLLVQSYAGPPGETMETAAPIKSGQVLDGSLGFGVNYYYYKLTDLVVGTSYTIETRGPSDLLGDLYAANKVTRLASNDDGGEGYNPKITFTASETTAYFVVRCYNVGSMASFDTHLT